MNGRPYPGSLSNRLTGALGGALRRILDDVLPQACFLCAQPTGDGQVCGRCQRHPRAFDRTVAEFLYGFPIGEMVQGLKYGHRLQVAAFFAEALAARLAGSAALPDLLLPMPLHTARLQARGFNQAAEIAR